MKKPERVESGQWWRGPELGIVRLEHNAGGGYDWLLGSCSGAEYLGSGEHPAPSEWMIETLAEHGYEALDRGVAPWADLTPRDHEVTRSIARRVVLGEPCDASKLYRQTLLSLYSILRSLGKW